MFRSKSAIPYGKCLSPFFILLTFLLSSGVSLAQTLTVEDLAVRTTELQKKADLLQDALAQILKNQEEILKEMDVVQIQLRKKGRPAPQ